MLQSQAYNWSQVRSVRRSTQMAPQATGVWAENREGMMPAKVYLPAPRKYRNQPQVVDGLRFASKREAKVYNDLKLLEKAGKIKNLVADKKKLRFPLEVCGVHICTYEADYQFLEMFGNVVWGRVTADAKGYKTREYQIKKRLMLALNGIEIREL